MDDNNDPEIHLNSSSTTMSAAPFIEEFETPELTYEDIENFDILKYFGLEIGTTRGLSFREASRKLSVILMFFSIIIIFIILYFFQG